jgi:26S proteasome regulatory subunit N5
VEFILYQMKLVLARNDFVRCQILSRKISNRALNEKGIEASKIQYYKNMVQYYVHEKELLEAAKAYQLIYDTINKATPEEAAVLEARYPNDRVEAFQNFVLYLLISSYDQVKVDLLKVVESTYPRELEKQENEKISSWVKKMLNFELMMI